MPILDDNGPGMASICIPETPVRATSDGTANSRSVAATGTTPCRAHRHRQAKAAGCMGALRG